jgi:WD40 repeat protein
MPRLHLPLLALGLLPLLAGAQGGPPRVPPGPGPALTDPQGDPLPPGALARMGTVRWRLGEAAQAIAFTPDGKGVVVCPAGQRLGPLRILQLPTGKEVALLKEVSYPGGLRLTARGKLLAVSYHGGFDLWELPAGRLVRRFGTKLGGEIVAPSPDGALVAAAGGFTQETRTYPVRLYEVATGRLLASLDGHRTPVQALTFSADGKRLLSASAEHRIGKAGGGIDIVPGFVRVWDLKARKPLAQYPNASYNLVLSPDGRAWAYLGQDNRLHVVESGGAEVARIPMEGSSAFAFSPDGKALATTGLGQPVRLWEVATGAERLTLEGRLGKGFPTLLFAPDGQTLACVTQSNWASPGGTVRFWGLPGGKEARPYPGHQSAVACVAQAPDGKTVASGGEDGSLFLWEAATGKALHRLPDHAGGARAVAFSPDGKLLASGGKDGTVRLTRRADGKQVRTFDGPGGGIAAVSFSADGKAVWACGEGGSLQGWDAVGGAGLGQFKLNAGPLFAAAFSADGGLLAHVGGVPGFEGSPWIRVCRVPSGKELRALDLTAQRPAKELANFAQVRCWAIALSPDGRLLATSESLQTQGLRLILSDHTIRVWELATGKQVLKVGVAVPARRLAFSPDGRVLAHGHGQRHGFGEGDQRVLLLRDLSAGESLHLLVTEKGEVTCMPGGARLRPLQGHVDGLSCVAFSSSGKGLLTGGGDGAVLAWSVAPFATGSGGRPAGVSAKELPALWERLAAEDAALGYQAIGRLERIPDSAIPFLKERLKPAPAADPRRVARLVSDLEDRRFAVRQKAFDELARYAEQAEDALRKALAGKPSLEARRRMQQLLDRLDLIAPSPDQLRALRALTLLERLGTPEARRVLEGLAGGAPTRVTREARAALERLARGKAN